MFFLVCEQYQKKKIVFQIYGKWYHIPNKVFGKN